jgi:HK97 family phage prohead protease
MSERNPVEYRSAVVADVSFPKRTIELVVMPYEEETTVEHQGRTVREVISRGAFDGIEGRPNRVKVNLDHDITRSLGKVLRFHPSRQVGLVADCYISPTAAGNDALQYAADGIYNASAGFAPIELRWEQGGRLRRVNKAWLAHIALVSDPAYTGARVLAVRTAPEAPEQRSAVIETPNLDQIRLWQLQESYARLGR